MGLEAAVTLGFTFLRVIVFVDPLYFFGVTDAFALGVGFFVSTVFFGF